MLLFRYENDWLVSCSRNVNAHTLQYFGPEARTPARTNSYFFFFAAKLNLRVVLGLAILVHY